MLIESEKILFLHIPKCAGKSVEIFFTGQDITNPHEKDWELRNRIIHGEFSDFYKFTVVRDPIQRFISMYNYYQGGGNNSSEDESIALRLEEFGFENFAMDLEAGKSFIIDKYKLNPQFEYMIKPQSDWIYHEGRYLLDDVVLLDELSTKLRLLGNKQHFKHSVPHANSKKSNNYSLADLSEAARSSLMNYYDADYIMLDKLQKKIEMTAQSA